MKKIIAATVLAALGMAQQAVAADGTVKFTGEIVEAPCVVATDSANQTVPLGQVKTTTFKAVGDKSVVKPFQIKLEECDITTGKTQANITFTGLAADGNATLLNVSTQSGSATGLGLELSDSKGTAIALGTAASDFTLKAGQNILDFGARYVATAATVTPGYANGTVDFNFIYK